MSDIKTTPPSGPKADVGSGLWTMQPPSAQISKQEHQLSSPETKKRIENLGPESGRLNPEATQRDLDSLNKYISDNLGQTGELPSDKAYNALWFLGKMAVVPSLFPDGAKHIAQIKRGIINKESLNSHLQTYINKSNVPKKELRRAFNEIGLASNAIPSQNPPLVTAPRNPAQPAVAITPTPQPNTEAPAFANRPIDIPGDKPPHNPQISSPDTTVQPTEPIEKPEREFDPIRITANDTSVFPAGFGYSSEPKTTRPAVVASEAPTQISGSSTKSHIPSTPEEATPSTDADFEPLRRPPKRTEPGSASGDTTAIPVPTQKIPIPG